MRILIIVSGIVGSLIPIPGIERIYIHFADPIDTVNYKCNLDSRDEVGIPPEV